MHSLTHLKGFYLVIPSVSPVQVVDPSVAPIFILGTPQTPSPIPVSTLISEYGILSLRVWPSSMLSP